MLRICNEMKKRDNADQKRNVIVTLFPQVIQTYYQKRHPNEKKKIRNCNKSINNVILT